MFGKGGCGRKRGALETICLLYERLVLVHEQLCLLDISVGQHLLLRELGHGFLGGIEGLLELCNRFGIGFLGRRGLQWDGGNGEREKADISMNNL